MGDEAIQMLSRMAMAIATNAAKTFMTKHGLSASNEALATTLQKELAAAIPDALADAREAFNCGMIEVADQTFRASMALAGIKAAQSVTRDPDRQNGHN